MERAYNRLKSELEDYKKSNQTQEKMIENKPLADHTLEQTERLNNELRSLQSSHDTLR